MMTKQPKLLITLVIAILLLALPAGVVNVHTHTDDKGKTCTLCQAPHLYGSFAAVPGLSSPLARPERALPRATGLVVDIFAAAVGSRAPPLAAPVS